MANDLEKQNSKLEKQNRKLKKKNKRGGLIIFILLLIILILFAIVFLFDPLGFGNGMGILKNGSTSASAASAPADTTAAVTEEAAAPAPTYIDVKVSGATLVCNGSESTAEDVVTAAKAVSGEVLVRITDDSATANAMEALTSALDAASVKYTIE